jgi:hypothetical protein
MEKLILATLLIGMVGGCTEPTVQRQRTQIVITQGGTPMNVVFIEGCEYLEYDQARSYICHKGNCKNPIHKGGNK